MASKIIKLLSVYLLTLLCGLVSYTSQAQQLAFPGAEGSGRFATGGRGGTVYEVTNLNDAGAGSLRDAVSQPNRTIVFRVSGIIRLNSRLSIRQNNLTIAGQTAPGDGICITGYTVNISASNIILRHLRCRLGDETKIDDDAMNGFASSITYQNIIIDHCSLSWSVDETGTFYHNKDFTLQWCILSESLYNSVHDKGLHGYGGIWGGQNASFHHNLIAHHTSRNPRFSGSRYTGLPDLEVVDFRNNVIYNWGNGNSAYGGEGGNYNMVNNYYRAGPATPGSLTTSSTTNRRNRILQYTSYYYSSDAAVYPDTLFGGKFYIDGNYVHGYPDVTADNWTKGVQKDNYPKADSLIAAARQNAPFPYGAVTTQTAENAYLSVLDNAGAILPHRDAIDLRIINEARNGTATYEGATYGAINTTGITHPSGIIDTQNDAGGLPVYSSTAALADTDQDGMPNSWETDNGLNPNDASDRNTIDASGYTKLEVYLNSITTTGSANTTPNVIASGTLASFTQSLGTPSSVQTYTVAGNNLTGPITVTPPAGYEISANNGANWYTNANPVILTPVNGTLTSTKISVRLNSSVQGSFSGNIVHTSSGAQTINVAANGSTTAPVVSPIVLLQQWPFTTNNQDSAAVRSAGVTASTPTFNRFTTSNGTTVPTVKAYSLTHGQAFAATADGLWTTAAGGPGGNLSRTHYEQFTVTASAGYTVKVDSILLNLNYYFTASNLKLAIVYSKSGFASDSAEVTGATFAAPTIPTQDNSGANTKYAFALNSSTGVTIAEGQTLSIRLYFSCGSGSSGRYALLKNVIVKGAASSTATPAVVVNGSLSSFSQVIGAPSAVQTFTVSGSNLTNDLTVTAPAFYEVSKDSAAWGSSVSFTPASGSVATSTVYIRLNATDAGSYNGDITVASTGATSATLAVTGTAGVGPLISVTSSFSQFSQNIGTPSASQSFTVSGSNLTANISVAIPANYEISANGNNWFSNATPLVLVRSGGSVPATQLFLRLNAPSPGTYPGNIVVSSSGASTVNVPVSGTAIIPVPPPLVPNVVVAKDGSGNFTTIQAAINAAPSGTNTPYIIFIKNGKYKEKISINKPFIHLVGESVANTIISWDDYSGKVVNGVTIGTNTSATLTLNSLANDFFMMNITVENAQGYIADGPQAVAILINSADRTTFKNCRFISGQDTVWHNGDGKRHYFRNCYIDGNTDFIFGSSIAVFDSCIIFPRDRIDGSNNGFITAANTPAGQAYGEVFRNSIITKNRGVTFYYLGRPWQNDAGTVDKKHNKTVFLNAVMGSSIRPEGWTVWDAGTNTSLITYAEYKSRNYNGTLVDVSKRVSWSKQLSDAEAAPYFANSNLVGTWDLCSASPYVCYSSAPDIAVSNFRAKKGTASTPSSLTWNLSWPMSNVTYELFRSTDKVSFSRINEQTSAVDSIVAFIYQDPVPEPGSTYYYYVKASKSGFAPHITDTIEVSSIPTITAVGTLSPLLQGLGAPSAVQAFSVSGVNLTQGITITPPAGYEVSANGGAVWYTMANPLVLPQSGNTVANTVVTVRLNAGSVGTYAGNIVLSSTGAVSVNVPVTGTVQAEPLPAPAIVLQQWPMTISNADSAAVRSPGVTASTPTFNNLYLSNGTTVPAVQAYSLTYGQAFASNPNGDGSWVPSPGGTLSRLYYEQFTITAAPNYKVRVDSILLNAAFYNTSNGRMAIVWSKSGFVSDSANVTGGYDYTGAPLVSTANGGFTTPIAPANQTGGTTNRYSLALNGATGVTLINGQTLTIRLYFAAGSSSAGRYAMIKNVVVKGVAKIPPTISLTGGTFTYDGTPKAATGYAYGINGGNDTLAPALTFSYQGIGSTVYNSTSAPVNAGTYKVVARYAGNTTYDTASATVNLTINKANSTVSVTGGTFTYDGNPHPATGFAYGVGGIGDVLSPAVTFIYEGINGTVYGPTAAAPDSAGQYQVTATFAGNDNYNGSSNTAFITINLPAFYQDYDLDTYGNDNTVVMAYTAPFGYVSRGGDCNDKNSDVHPGAPELPDNMDNDCDGLVDEGLTLNTYYQDYDRDTYGNDGASIQASIAPVGYVTVGGDCNDKNSDVHPGASELPDNMDNDCDGQIDEGLTLNTYYQDYDRDTYGNDGASIQASIAPVGYVTVGGDCNDKNSNVYPGAPEIGDNLDNNCNGQIDEGLSLTTFYQDYDRDGYGNSSAAIQASKSPGAGWVTTGGDCNDKKNSIHPGATEVLNGIDDNCNGAIDEGLSSVSVTSEVAEEAMSSVRIKVSALPNPTASSFTLSIQSKDNKPVQIRVINVLGSVVEQRQNVIPNSTIRIGSSYRSGIYFLEVVQGTERKIERLIKE